MLHRKHLSIGSTGNTSAACVPKDRQRTSDISHFMSNTFIGGLDEEPAKLKLELSLAFQPFILRKQKLSGVGVQFGLENMATFQGLGFLGRWPGVDDIQ